MKLFRRKNKVWTFVIIKGELPHSYLDINITDNPEQSTFLAYFVKEAYAISILSVCPCMPYQLLNACTNF
jgi:hypothetical protein